MGIFPAPGGPPSTGQALFGNGDDGDLVPPAGETVVTKSLTCSNLYVPPGATLRFGKSAGNIGSYELRVRNQLVVAPGGAILADGEDAVGTVGAGAPTGGTRGAGAAGKNGATGNGTAGGNVVRSYSENAGAGGNGSGGRTGGAGGTATPHTADEGVLTNIGQALLGRTNDGYALFQGGPSGGSGAGDGVNAGGGSAAGGNCLTIAARRFINHGLIASRGGKGGDAPAGDAGGGGGGAGGTIVAIHEEMVNDGTFDVSGGAGGAGHGTGTAGKPGGEGHVIHLPQRSDDRILVAVSVVPATASVAAGFTKQYLAIGLYADGSQADVTSAVTWSSSDPTIATINAAGLATTLIQGATTIRAIAADGTVGTSALTVTAPAITSIDVTPTAPTIAPAGTQQFAALAHYSNGTTGDVTATAAWASSDHAVATIDGSGLATGVGQGHTNVTATKDAIVSNTADLHVTAVASISDSFVRANGAMGNTDTGQPWADAFGGGFVISLNHAVVAALSAGNNAGAVVDAAFANQDVFVRVGQWFANIGLLARYLDDSNTLFLDFDISGSWALYNAVGGTFNLVASAATPLPSNAGGDTVALDCNGTTVKYLYNGGVVGTWTIANNAANTKAGLFGASSVGSKFGNGLASPASFLISPT